VIKTVSCY